MNRQIKFRAWDAKEDKMHVPDYPFIGGGSGALDICLTIDGKIKTPNSYGLDYGFTPPVPELVMMQFTGLTDKNGKDIYEGDIIEFIGGTCSHLRCGNYASEYHKIGTILIVRKLESGYTLSPIRLLKYETPNLVGNVHNYDFWNNQKGLQVIGNIHEHPHLLK